MIPKTPALDFVIPGRREAANPESRAARTELAALDSGSGADAPSRNDRGESPAPPLRVVVSAHRRPKNGVAALAYARAR